MLIKKAHVWAAAAAFKAAGTASICMSRSAHCFSMWHASLAPTIGIDLSINIFLSKNAHKLERGLTTAKFIYGCVKGQASQT